MAAVSAELLETIIELQGLSSLKNAILGGGTNLAIRYDHRESIDIDLFFSEIIGKTGYKEIENEIQAYFAGNASRLDYPCDESDQYMFMRFWVKKHELNIKIEILGSSQEEIKAVPLYVKYKWLAIAAVFIVISGLTILFLNNQQQRIIKIKH